MSRSSHDGDGHCGCKVGSLCTDYGMDDIHRRLREEWSGDDGRSVRELTAWFNKQLIGAKLDAEYELLLDGEIDLLYELLTSDEASAGMRVQTRNRLEKRDLDVDRLEEEFVSHQTLYRHLTDCLSMSFERENDGDRVRDKLKRKLERLENRVSAVVEDELERASKKEWFTMGRFTVLVRVTVTCQECGRHGDVREIVSNGGCDCPAEDGS